MWAPPPPPSPPHTQGLDEPRLVYQAHPAELRGRLFEPGGAPASYPVARSSSVRRLMRRGGSVDFDSSPR